MTLPQKPSRKAAHNFVVCNMRPSSVRSFNRHAECWYLLLRLALFAVLLAAVSSPANAITYYVSPDGSDKATGTSPQKPWKTIGKVNATALRPGDIVLFKGQATFSGKIYLSPGINGTNGMPITLGSYNPSSGAALSPQAPPPPNGRPSAVVLAAPYSVTTMAASRFARLTLSDRAQQRTMQTALLSTMICQETLSGHIST